MQNLSISTYVEGQVGLAFHGRGSFAKRSRELKGKKIHVKRKELRPKARGRIGKRGVFFN